MEYFPPSNGASRNQLAEELRRVETVCESALLREIRFPTANASNPQVEVWVEEVIHNWEVLCGPSWQDNDFGEGGQSAIGHNVLDVSIIEWFNHLARSNFSRYSTEPPAKPITLI
jgi:hypothetical protein